MDRSSTLNSHIKESPPTHVYHYTSPGGLIGILKSKHIWATNIRFLNDFKELEEASDVASKVLNKMYKQKEYSKEKKLLNKMLKNIHIAASRHYVCSFSEDPDSLSQWRAYSPHTGGYALGIPSSQLTNLATETGWYFIKCIYNESEKETIIREVIDSFILEFRNQRKNRSYLIIEKNLDTFETKIALEFQSFLAQIGGIIKNKAFEEEREWRLISSVVIENKKNEQDEYMIEFREGIGYAIPYFKFPLVTEKNPNLTKYNDEILRLTIGPTPQSKKEASHAAQFLLHRYLGVTIGHEHSIIPYKGW
ncbi:MAG: DUF2971 domain-containing protein [Balneolaceae bacterium]|jgi:hypothetical protein|nr:MAG: DUF2971 domain-containing protein [Balneolaceae bacterium]